MAAGSRAGSLSASEALGGVCVEQAINETPEFLVMSGDDEHDAESFVGGGGVVQNDEGDPETLKVTSHMRHHQVQRSASFLTNKLSAPTPRSKPSSFLALPWRRSVF